MQTQAVARSDVSPPKRQRKPKAARTDIQPGEWQLSDPPVITALGGWRLEPANTSGIRPVEFKVLIKPQKTEEVTKGGIIIPETAQDRFQAAAVEGEIIAVSPLAFTYEKWPDELKPKVGDRVFYAKYAGMKVTGRDGVEYLILADKDIAAVIA